MAEIPKSFKGLTEEKIKRASELLRTIHIQQCINQAHSDISFTITATKEAS